MMQDPGTQTANTALSRGPAQGPATTSKPSQATSQKQNAGPADKLPRASALHVGTVSRASNTAAAREADASPPRQAADMDQERGSLGEAAALSKQAGQGLSSKEGADTQQPVVPQAQNNSFSLGMRQPLSGCTKSRCPQVKQGFR